MILRRVTSEVKSVRDVYPFEWDVKSEERSLEEIEELWNSGDQKVDAKGKRIE